jgi:acetate kinase
MNNLIVVLNGGSSSLKFSIYQVSGEKDLELSMKGQIEGIGTAPRFIAKDRDGKVLGERQWADASSADRVFLFGYLAGWATGQIKDSEVVGAGHRIVHGGTDFSAPALIDDALMSAVEKLVPLAPLHLPHNLAYIKAAKSMNPELPQVACFDTAFHRGHPEVAERFALPEELYGAGVRRYGFHGLSYEYIAQELQHVAPEIAEGRVVVAHLGSGASMCAIKGGRSVDSTMGFSALDGLPMGTRCGALDPAVPLYLIAEKGYDVPALERLFYHDSGLLGLSGVSNDMRDLEASEDPKAELALDYFVYRINRELGALAAVMDGLDAVVFTAGIGERSPGIRARVCADARWLGLQLDEAANQAGGPRISTVESAVSAWVIPTDEEKMIALHTQRLLRGL